MNGTDLIRAERERQVAEEGWTPEHDDNHTECELLDAARKYMEWPGSLYRAPDGWPFEDETWKQSGDPVRDLVKAGALIAAEIDRLQRADSTSPERCSCEATGECRVAMSGPTCFNPDCPPCQTPELETDPNCPCMARAGRGRADG